MDQTDQSNPTENIPVPPAKQNKNSKQNDTKPSAPPAPKSFARRDHLRNIEIRVQEQWANSRIFEAERKYDDNGKPVPKFMATFPYPYMNGRLHLGHAFSFSKAEFTCRFQRLNGKNVLMPFGFHCTGMPIQAAANKLREEIRLYGCPPVFPVEEVEVVVEEKGAEAAIAAKSKGKKSKLAVKGLSNKVVRQWDILTKMVPVEEIPQFADPIKWLEYFPPYGVTDLQAFGSCIDWRRSFITTSANPYYDAFVRWQFNHLREGGRIRFGKRPSVYSVLDGQVCADHDRASGEEVGPQEYCIIKLRVLEVPVTSPLFPLHEQGKRIYLAPATLRPETMYGQTNVFVLPEGVYGAFEIANGDILIMSDRAAKGMAHQDYTSEFGKIHCHVHVKGHDLLGLPVHAPNSAYARVYTLPLLSISMGKGTGVVTSVPSDAPDDFAALRELKDKPLFREKFNLTAEMVEPFDVVPIIDIPGYGNLSAVTMCERLNIKSPNDAAQLKVAKDEVYLKGFYEGVMLVGPHAGMKVCDAKPLIKQAMVDAGDVLIYYEPESLVMSRSGEECIVALADQWYLAYGEPDWQDMISKHIHDPNSFNGYNNKIMEKFDQVISWLKDWACSRQFGLGTRLSWDDQFVIESLSDSTVYMAYYTIALFIQGSSDNLNGVKSPNKFNIQPEHMTDAVFDYIFLRKSYPSDCMIAEDLLRQMKDEFEYWYPMDLRVSGKDLISNHLTFSLYNHAEIWKDRPEMWPRGFYCNGHIMVDAEKMSKSTGNFLLMKECVDDYSADATRFAIADSGDSMEDANFDRSVANQAIISLFNEEEFIKSVLDDEKSGKLRNDEQVFMDRAFVNEINYMIERAYERYNALCFRDALQIAWFEMLIARDFYRDWAVRSGTTFHVDAIKLFLNAIAVMMSPIIPHWCENIWSTYLNNTTSICCAKWPVFQPYDPHLHKQYTFLRDSIKSMRLSMMKAKEGGKNKCYIYVATVYEPIKIEVLKYLQAMCGDDGSFPATIISDMKAFLEGREDLKKDTTMLMQFGSFMKKEAQECGRDILATEMPFDQISILQDNISYITQSLDLQEIHIFDIRDPRIPASEAKKRDSAIPGKPAVNFLK